jgi:hypothetical protein
MNYTVLFIFEKLRLAPNPRRQHRLRQVPDVCFADLSSRALSLLARPSGIAAGCLVWKHGPWDRSWITGNSMV